MPEVTYHKLDVVLRSLGFTVNEPEKGTRVYKHPQSGALLVMPVLPDRDPVREHHLVGARMTLDAFGIADPPDFTSRLQKAS
jgi:predicted RNA binding protein YcfA (HicA-like mRNA interferase family)